MPLPAICTGYDAAPLEFGRGHRRDPQARLNILKTIEFLHFSKGSSWPRRLSVRENVVFGKARQVEFGAHGEKLERGLGKFAAAVAIEHQIEFGLDGMQMQHV